MKKKFFSILVILMVVLLSTSPVFALTINTGNNNQQSSNGVVSGVTTLEQVDRNICEIDLKDGVTNDVVGKFRKELTHLDEDKKEATLTLTIENLNKKETIKKPVEVFLVLDNSNSMTLEYKQKPKIDYVVETANAFTDALFKHFESPKIGIVSFSAVKDPETLDDEPSVFGTKNDAKLLLELSDSKDTIKSKIAEYKTDTEHGTKTNIEAGLSIVEEKFTTSTESEKYVILISDGVPNISLGVNKVVYSGTTATNTKNKLKEMDNKGYNIFSVLLGLNESEGELTIDNTTGEKKTRRALAEEIFGTVSQPTAGDFFYIDYESLNTTINTNVYNDIVDLKDTTLKDIKIKDYFPKEILDNFNLTYIDSYPDIGDVNEVNTEENSITWNIETLEAEQVATLKYKLTLKDDYDKSIVDKVLPTNSKVDISFKNTNGTASAYSTVSPSVKVKYVESAKEEPKKDPTIAKTPVPQTGLYSNMIIVFAIIALIVLAISKAVAYRKLK